MDMHKFWHDCVGQENAYKFHIAYTILDEAHAIT